MSAQAREQLVAASFFQRESQKADLLNPDMTNTGLIALLLDIVNAGHILEFTAVRSDHGDDSGLGFHCHAHGFCADLWPLSTPNAGDYLDADSAFFAAFLRDAAKSTWLYQIGLAGSAYTSANVTAAGPSVFHDDGADHVHLGAE